MKAIAHTTEQINLIPREKDADVDSIPEYVPIEHYESGRKECRKTNKRKG